MKTNTLIISILTMFWAAILMSQTVLAKADSRYNPYRPNVMAEEGILKPSWTMSCESNFVIENLGDEEAEISISLGIEGFTEDQMSASEKRGYDLRESLAFAKQLGKTVTMDDVALITNTSDNARVRVHC